MDLHWTWRRFDALSLDDLYDALALRSRVFSVEQACAYLDPDGVDRRCWHLLGRDAAGVLQAYLRGVDPGVKYDCASIGRVVTAPAWRGTGAGRRLVAEGLRRMDGAWPGQALRISAQAHLQRFYAGFGFQPQGEQYLEDDIPHIEMWRPAPQVDAAHMVETGEAVDVGNAMDAVAATAGAAGAVPAR